MKRSQAERTECMNRNFSKTIWLFVMAALIIFITPFIVEMFRIA